ncbi:dna polymerase delta subunit 4-like [Stylonychia lemnae]|uniref:Dna polymerase delta subunit 4-like n=1 Tax=Stylonychia lemnae TaxID=5949 RepID=A0A078ARR6_STYLE|nr:dna polymerase delta subunit 4-like [Stylonychia lemnae]|eukprot:CDW84681.1 dna polymerase delta subunit 4-like [Stylonychia lemnae]
MSNLNHYFKQDKKGIKSNQYGGISPRLMKQSQVSTALHSKSNQHPSHQQQQFVSQEDQQRQFMLNELVMFDANPDFGPCKGISRMQRWNNSNNLGLNPPDHIPGFIEQTGDNKSFLEQYMI